jgi:uncharacterized membrane protein YfcA
MPFTHFLSGLFPGKRPHNNMKFHPQSQTPLKGSTFTFPGEAPAVVLYLQIPSLIAILSWYKRQEFGIRAAIFFSAASASGAFGGLLAVRIDGITSLVLQRH